MIAVCLWKSSRRIFPDIPIHGCHFHWAQAVYRQVQSLGLGNRFRQERCIKKQIKRLLALPVLPWQHIEEAFTNIQQRTSDAAVCELMNYIKRSWIDSSVWPPASWSQYQRHTRTNNDVEGWHRRFNMRAFLHSPPNLYKLITELYRESLVVTVQVRLVSQKKLTKTVIKKYQTVQGALFKMWGQYRTGEYSTSRLLKNAAHLMTFGDVEV